VVVFILCRQGRDTYILRQGQDLEPTLDITVTNDKEDAHETTLNLTLPANLEYRGIDERVSGRCQRYINKHFSTRLWVSTLAYIWDACHHASCMSQ
jgi:hypothetical protein